MTARLVEGYHPQFDLDLRRGQRGERIVAAFIEGFTNGTIEVKSDAKWIETQRIYIEFECRRADGWQPSGIVATKATYWALVLHESIVIGVPTWALRWCYQRALDPKLRLVREEKDGSHPTRGVAIPLGLLLTWLLMALRKGEAAAA